MRRPKCTISVSRGANFYVNECGEDQNAALEKAQRVGGQVEKDFTNLVFWSKNMVRYAASKVNSGEEGDEGAQGVSEEGGSDTVPTSFADKGAANVEENPSTLAE